MKRDTLIALEGKVKSVSTLLLSSSDSVCFKTRKIPKQCRDSTAPVICCRNNLEISLSIILVSATALKVINPLMTGGNKKVSHTLKNQQLSGAGMCDLFVTTSH